MLLQCQEIGGSLDGGAASTSPFNKLPVRCFAKAKGQCQNARDSKLYFLDIRLGSGHGKSRARIRFCGILPQEERQSQHRIEL